jgi:hypothetical protein
MKPEPLNNLNGFAISISQTIKEHCLSDRPLEAIDD